MRNQKGITLVALVITIIVLLILAGVSISLVVGQNGVLGKASDAVVTNKAAGVKEKVSSALAAAEIAYQSAWAQGISSGSSTTRAIIYDGTTTPTVVEGEVVKDLKKVYNGTSDSVVISGSLVGATAGTYNVLIQSGTDAFVFAVSVDESTGKTTIGSKVKYYEKQSSKLTEIPTGEATKEVALN